MHGRPYYRDAMLVSFDQEGEDAADDHDQERRNGRHPEQIWFLLPLKKKLLESAHARGGKVTMHLTNRIRYLTNRVVLTYQVLA